VIAAMKGKGVPYGVLLNKIRVYQTLR